MGRGERADHASSAGSGTFETAGSLLCWYALNGAFNVANKRMLNEFAHPWVASWVQLATGIVIVVPAWTLGFRRMPDIDRSVLFNFAPMAMLHASGHALQVAGIGAGSVYLGTVIKATEPIIGALVAFATTGKTAPWYVNLTFLPIVGGIAYAAAKPSAQTDLSDLFSFAALAALASTIFFAMAKVLAKQAMSEVMKARGFDAVNTYSLLTCCSAVLLLIPSMAAEGPQAWATLRAAEDGGRSLALRLLLCGFYYYAYNEFGFRVLDALGAVSQAVANSAKRVVILFFAVYFLGEAASTRKLVGAAIAILGVMSYSLAKLYADHNAAAAKAKEA